MSSEGPEPALVVSLDFELHWGLTERVLGPGHPYCARLHGACEIAPRLLALFEERGIHATWAPVGMVFARGGADLETFKPVMRPAYERSVMDTYRVPVGRSEETDPLHFAPTLIQRIWPTPGQEVACRTFSQNKRSPVSYGGRSRV